MNTSDPKFCRAEILHRVSKIEIFTFKPVHMGHAIQRTRALPTWVFLFIAKWSVSQKKNALGKKYCNEHEWPKIFSGQNFTSSVQDWNYYIQTCTQRICNIADTCSPNMNFSIYSKWSVSQKKNALGKKYYCIENKWPKILSSRNLHRVFKIEIITFKPVHTGHAR